MKISNKKTLQYAQTIFLHLAMLTLSLSSVYLLTPKKAHAIVSKTSKGPNNGILRSAGKFKTELTIGRYIEVYLLDKSTSNPTISQSNVKGRVFLGNKEYKLRFWPKRKGNKFIAVWPAPINTPKERSSQSFSIVLLPTRKKSTGIPVLYEIGHKK